MDVGSTPTISSFNAINSLDNGRRTPTKRKLCFMGLFTQDFCDGSFVEKVPSLGQMRLIYSVDI